MKAEYLLFNLIIIAGPVALSFDRRVHFISDWPRAFLAALSASVPFIVWDILVEGRHWWFNPEYTLGFKLAGLPFEEWLFFITVPFACVFIWQVLAAYFPDIKYQITRSLSIAAAALIIAGIVSAYYGLEYTAISALLLGGIIILDSYLGCSVLTSRRGLTLFAIVTVLMLIFNGYLTSRPVVIYDPRYQLNFRIFTIPVEDFLFGYAHILLTLFMFVKFRRVANA
ncbi:MAG: lycopene cyclase domain-containing protein [Calditrichaceae bacterium]|nr:lycopene cyclase domain-containing protein [Calditrichaceae bacterium]RQV92974.1 MAG: lycopene cyclase domain-containing protein [Calditrichota bacterium]